MCDLCEFCVFRKIHQCIIAKFLFENELVFNGNDKIIIELKLSTFTKEKICFVEKDKLGVFFILVKIRINFAVIKEYNISLGFSSSNRNVVICVCLFQRQRRMQIFTNRLIKQL